MLLLTYCLVTKEHKPRIERNLFARVWAHSRKKKRDEPEGQSYSGKVKSGKIRAG